MDRREPLQGPPAHMSPVEVPHYAKKRAESQRQDIEAVVSNMALKLVRGQVVAVDAIAKKVQIRRATSLVPGTQDPGPPDEEYYPVRGGAMPVVGDHVYGFESSGGAVILGNAT